jgi:hypothetical protein
MKRVYVAGAYSADNILDIFDNMRRGIRWSVEVLLAGHAPFCPWLDFQYTLSLREGETLSLQDFYSYSLAWLRVSDVVFVTPGWEASTGTANEILTADELGIPVIFRLEDLGLSTANMRFRSKNIKVTSPQIKFDKIATNTIVPFEFKQADTEKWEDK